MTPEWLTVGNEDFLDPRRSPNGRFVVAARDHGYAGDREMPGACVLLEGDRLRFRKTIRRATNPHVNDRGLVVVEDWKDASKLEGALIALDGAGALRWQLELRANIFTSGMSSDGARVFVSTCNSDDPDHGGRTFLLDAASGAIVLTRRGWGDVRFDGNVLVAEVKLSRGTRAFPFDANGQLGADYEQAVAAERDERGRGQHWSVLPKLEAAFKVNPLDVGHVTALFLETETHAASYPPRAQAKLLRCRGDLAEAQGNLALAVDYWEQARTRDPKSSVARRLERARAALARQAGVG